MRNFHSQLNRYNTCVTPNESDYISNFNCKTSNYYGFPKIYKIKFISDGCKNLNSEHIKITPQEDLEHRPFNAGPACETHCLSQFLYIPRKHFMKHIQTFIRYDLDVFNHLPGTVNKNIAIVFFDVSKPYTNICSVYGQNAIETWLEIHESHKPNCIESCSLSKNYNSYCKINPLHSTTRHTGKN